MAQSDTKPQAGDETAAPQPLAGSVIAPGQTVDLHTAADKAPPPAPEPPKAVTPTPPAAEPAQAPAQAAPAVVQEQAPAPPAAAVMSAEPQEPSAPIQTDAEKPLISWTASEFMAHDKSAGWYVALIAGAAVFAAGVYIVTKDIISTVVVIVAAIILAVLGSHKPKEQLYMLDEQGINIGPKHYPYESFKSFAVASEGAFSSLVFMPLKRFAVPLTIYYAPEDEERIVNLLNDRLPLEEHRLDAVDNLMRRIRF